MALCPFICCSTVAAPPSFRPVTFSEVEIIQETPGAALAHTDFITLPWYTHIIFTPGAALVHTEFITLPWYTNSMYLQLFTVGLEITVELAPGVLVKSHLIPLTTRLLVGRRKLMMERLEMTDDDPNKDPDFYCDHLTWLWGLEDEYMRSQEVDIKYDPFRRKWTIEDISPEGNNIAKSLQSLKTLAVGDVVFVGKRAQDNFDLQVRVTRINLANLDTYIPPEKFVEDIWGFERNSKAPPVGKGEFSNIFKIYNQRTKKYYAMKCQAKISNIIGRPEWEMQSLTALTGSPFVNTILATIVDTNYKPGIPITIMPLAKYGTLKDFLNAPPNVKGFYDVDCKYADYMILLRILDFAMQVIVIFTLCVGIVITLYRYSYYLLTIYGLHTDDILTKN